MERFETQYPITARQKGVKQILQFVTRGQSCQLISVPGAGRSTALRLLAYHKKLCEHHFSSNRTIEQSNNYLFIYDNFAEIPSFDAAQLNKFLFLSIFTAIREVNDPQLAKIGKEIYAIFKEALSVGDPLVMSQRLKRAIEQLNNSAIIPVFLFDRFSEFSDKVPAEFFTQLRTLKSASSGKLAVVFSVHRPIEELIPQQTYQDFYEFFAGNNIYLEMYDKVATRFRISVLEKEYGKKLPPKVKEELIKITSGHGKLMKLATQILLTPQGWLNGLPRGGTLIDFLLDHALIKSSLLEIWQSLKPEEKTKPLFPLYNEFVKRGVPETLIPKIIRFDQKNNEIYFGDEVLTGLTAHEFRLLKFLINNPNRVAERDEVINAVWQDNKTQAGVTDQALDQMIHRLRRKVEDEADNPKHLLTVKGRGFRFLP